MAEPKTFPATPEKTTSKKLKVPCETKKPENGIIISDGIGIAALSSVIKKKIPIYPDDSIV